MFRERLTSFQTLPASRVHLTASPNCGGQINLSPLRADRLLGARDSEDRELKWGRPDTLLRNAAMKPGNWANGIALRCALVLLLAASECLRWPRQRAGFSPVRYPATFA